MRLLTDGSQEGGMYYSTLYDLIIGSWLPLPCGQPLQSVHPTRDVSITRASRKLDEFKELSWIGGEYGNYLRSYDVGPAILLCISDNIRVTIAKKDDQFVVDADENLLPEAIVNTVGVGLSIHLLYRGVIPLHAASVVIGGKLVGLIAPSRTGKSTLLWACLKQGFDFVSDDMLPVKFIGDQPLATPSMSPYLRLWQDELERTGRVITECREVLPGLGKYWVALESERCVQGQSVLDGIFVLHPDSGWMPDHPIVVRRQTGASILTSLLGNTQGLWAVPRAIAMELFRTYGKLARSVPVYTLEYPRHRQVLPYLADTIREITCHTGARTNGSEAWQYMSVSAAER